MDTTPEMSAECQRAALIEAAILYGRIAQAWGSEPWILVSRAFEPGGPDKWSYKASAVTDEDCRLWGHYAVMSAVGHGVSWEDSHNALTKFNGDEVRVSGAASIESFDWDWAREMLEASDD